MDSGDESDAPCVRDDGAASAIAINSEYAVIVNHDGVQVQDLADPGRPTWDILQKLISEAHTVSLAISTISPNLLAIAQGSRIWVLDVRNTEVKHIFKGNGRTVTAIAFHPVESDLLATGTIDGAICVWSFETPSRPIYQIVGNGCAITKLAFHPDRSDIIAALRQDQVTIWSRQLVRSIQSMTLVHTRVIGFGWLFDSPVELLVLCSDGTGTTIRLNVDPEQLRDPKDDYLSLPDDVEQSRGTLGASEMLASSINFGHHLKQVHVVGPHALLALSCDEDILELHVFAAENRLSSKIWTLCIDPATEAFTVRVNHSSAEVLTCFRGFIGVHSVPQAVYDQVDWTSHSADVAVTPEVTFANPATMSPALLCCDVHVRDKLTDSHLEPRLKPFFRSRTTNLRKLRKLQFDTPNSQSMTSSLELPPDGGPPGRPAMPFLSPAIPARQLSDAAGKQIEGNLRLPPPTRASFNSVQTPENDSDSDDEIFPTNAKLGDNLLPSGVNVPLPRTCGAQFSLSGQLLVFLPIKPKPIYITEDTGLLEPDRIETKVSQLFPAFGNLNAAQLRLRSSTDTTTVQFGTSQNLHKGGTSQIASFDSQPLWKTKSHDVAAESNFAQRKTRVALQVHPQEACCPPQPFHNLDYHFLPRHGETLRTLCDLNASTARLSGASDVADIWLLLGFVLQPALSHLIEAGQAKNMSAIITPRRSAGYHNHQTDVRSKSAREGSTEHTTDRHHPFRGDWAVRRLLDWVEKRADITLLATVSAMMLSGNGESFAIADLPGKPIKDKSRPSSPGLTMHLRDSVETYGARSKFTTLEPKPTSYDELDESPVKLHSSRTSSRNPSQPTTPYLDSTASTPPMAFATFSRQSSRLSASGSASPEHNRSSFSAAARSYAQSITDKFALYSSSPPFRKSGTSPGNNLSSSFPSNSWSKSVSFAPSVDTAKGSRHESNAAREDYSRENPRTMQSSKQPALVRKEGAEVPIAWKNQGLFDVDSTSNTAAFEPPFDVRAKFGVWCQGLSRVLRAQNAIIEAAELDRISNNAYDPDPPTRFSAHQVVPRTRHDQNHPVCSICATAIIASEQICTVCLHTTHPRCLEDYLQAAFSDAFSCPSGCGCDCTLAEPISFDTHDIVVHESESGNGNTEFKKRPKLQRATLSAESQVARGVMIM